MALCASESQLDDVLDAIDGVEAMVDRSVLPELLADDGVVEVLELEELAELLDESDDEGVAAAEKFETGKPLKIDEMDIATRYAKRGRP